MLPTWLGFVIAAAAVAAVVFLCVVLVRHYEDRHDREAGPTAVTVATIALALCCVVLVPIDVFATSSAPPGGNASLSSASPQHPSSLSSFSTSSAAAAAWDPTLAMLVIRYLYFVLYGVLAVMVFIVAPFAYFYFEEYDEDISTRRRVFGALKYTVFLLVVVVILLIVGLFVKTGSSGDAGGNPREWWEALKRANNSFEGAIGFLVACMTVVGFLLFLVYTAYGLSSLPIGLIRGRRQVTEEVSDAQQNLEMTRQKQRLINAKYASGIRVSKRDEQQLTLLRQQERVYEQHTLRLTRAGASRFAKCAKYAKPLLILVGIVFLLLTLLLVVSIIMTQIDKIINTHCGFKCGYVLSSPKINNPLDMLLVILADYFPLDSIVLGAIVAYLFFATVSGIRAIGIRFLWIELFRVRPKRTPPQGLLLTAIFLTLTVLAMCLELLTLAPRYVSFGTQTYIANGTELLCDMQATTSQCHMTEVATFFYSVTGVNQSFLGIIFYYGTWLFVLAWIIGILVAFFKRKEANIEVTQDEIDDEDLDGPAVPSASASRTASRSTLKPTMRVTDV